MLLLELEDCTVVGADKFIAASIRHASSVGAATDIGKLSRLGLTNETEQLWGQRQIFSAPKVASKSDVAPTLPLMAEHRWAPPEHQDVPIYAAESMPVDQVGSPEPVGPPQPVWIDRLRFDQIGELERVKAFAVARSDVAVFVETAWQGRLQRAWVPRSSVSTRNLQPRR